MAPHHEKERKTAADSNSLSFHKQLPPPCNCSWGNSSTGIESGQGSFQSGTEAQKPIRLLQATNIGRSFLGKHSAYMSMRVCFSEEIQHSVMSISNFLWLPAADMNKSEENGVCACVCVYRSDTRAACVRRRLSRNLKCLSPEIKSHHSFLFVLPLLLTCTPPHSVPAHTHTHAHTVPVQQFCAAVPLQAIPIL